MKTTTYLCATIILAASVLFNNIHANNSALTNSTHSTKVSTSPIKKIPYTTEKIVIDGEPNESIWKNATWYPIDQLLLGEQPSATDFSGKFALAWNENRLYLMAEIVDDVLSDQHFDPLDSYWDDDCLEIFIDENNSGGEHLFTHNAFAYHLALDNQVVDMSTLKQAKLYNEHVKNKWKSAKNSRFWEAEIAVFDDTYQDNSSKNKPVKLTMNKKIGFMLAYCDNDYSKTREHFMGSEPIAGPDKNLGYKTADVFGTIQLIK